MIGNRGIDQEVQSKVDAYRGNPNALAQKYSQNQQLIDLLALQKLKSEKESAAREMQLKMGGQQMPTVAEARENEVLDLTKQELAQNTTGAMQQQQAQQQKAAKDLVERTAQMPMQSQSLMTQGVAGLPANNMSHKAMAAGGIVAFQEGGRAEDEIDPAVNEEMMRFIAAQRRGAEAPPARQSDMASLARQGIRNLIGTRTPQEVFMERQEAATRAAGYSPEERDRLERHLKDRESIDARRFDPDRRRSDALTQFLLGAAGRTGIGSVLAGGGVGALNYRNAMDAAERAAMVDRQKQEADIIDVGPAARFKGMQLGSEGERTAMTGLAQGTGDAVQLARLQAAQAGSSGLDANTRLRLQQAEQRFDNAKKQIFTQMKDMGVNPDSPEAVPFYNRINQQGEAIYDRFQVKQFFVPDPPPATAETPAQQPGFFARMFGARTPPSAPSGGSPRVVPFSSLQN